MNIHSFLFLEGDQSTVRTEKSGGRVDRATDLTRGREVRNSLDTSTNFRESCAIRRAGGDDKCDTIYAVRRRTKDGQEPGVSVNRAVIQLRRGVTTETIMRGRGDVTAWGRVQ